MKVPTTISFILGKNVIYQTSSEQELFKDSFEGDYENLKIEIKNHLKLVRYDILIKVNFDKNKTI